MNHSIQAQIKAHAIKDAPYEACGLVVVNQLGEVSVIPCENRARNKRGQFIISVEDERVAEKKGHVAAFYHSHADDVANPSLESFSREDLDISYECGIPALLYTHPNDTWKFNVPVTYTPANLLGRPFAWGIWDCYTLVRDYYLINKKVVMGSYLPPENATEASDFGYETLAQKENFHEVPLSEAREGDVMLIKLKSNFINHCLIYLGGNEYLHQPALRISSKGTLDERIQKYVAKTLRYND